MTDENPRQALDFDCVFVARSESEQRFVAGMVGPAGIRVHYAASLEDADRLLRVTNAAVLLVDAEFGGPWQDAMELLKKHHPAGALVLASEKADESFWIDALEKGAYDLVLKPFVGSELRRILQNANVHARLGGIHAAAQG